VDCVIKVIVLFVSASGIRENLCFWSKRARILNAQRTVSGSILAAGQEKFCRDCGAGNGVCFAVDVLDDA
jgi:hypothetical protein